jgi:hypothetical protein
MSSLDDYNSKIDIIKAIGEDKMAYPNMPVDVYLQETENLYQWALEDKDQLVAMGLQGEFVDDLLVRSGVLRHAESIWAKERFSREEAEKQWMIESPQAYDLRDELITYFRFAFRKDESLLGRVSAIAEGNSHADMIQDLNDLSVLGNANPELLAATNLDMTMLTEAADMSKRMAALLGETTRDRADYSESKKIRDQAYTHLKEAVDEIISFGKFVFRHQEERKKKYRCQYKRRKKTQPTADTNKTTPGPALESTVTASAAAAKITG